MMKSKSLYLIILCYDIHNIPPVEIKNNAFHVKYSSDLYCRFTMACAVSSGRKKHSLSDIHMYIASKGNIYNNSTLFHNFIRMNWVGQIYRTTQ